MDKIGEILRAYLEQARPIKEIVRTLSVSRATVRKGKAAPIVPPCLRARIDVSDAQVGTKKRI